MYDMWTDYELDRLTDLVFDSNLSVREMGIELGRPELEVTKQIRELGLSWVRRKKGHVSRGQAALTRIMQKLLPGERIVTEEPIGERLRLDVYCPRYQLAAEYHGRQHFYYTEHFHGDKRGFDEARERDERKEQLCRDLGIVLVVFRYCDNLTQDSVYERLLHGLRNPPPVVDTTEEVKYSQFEGPWYDEYKRRQREYRRDQYQRMKKWRARA